MTNQPKTYFKIKTKDHVFFIRDELKCHYTDITSNVGVDAIDLKYSLIAMSDYAIDLHNMYIVKSIMGPEYVLEVFLGLNHD
jgi:hypothetical protein